MAKCDTRNMCLSDILNAHKDGWELTLGGKDIPGDDVNDIAKLLIRSGAIDKKLIRNPEITGELDKKDYNTLCKLLNKHWPNIITQESSRGQKQCNIKYKPRSTRQRVNNEEQGYTKYWSLKIRCTTGE